MKDVVRHRWIERARLKSETRRFFDGRDFTELDTPIAVLCPGTEVHLRYFETAWEDHLAKKHKLFLRSSPELHMKQALAHGMSRIYQLATCFRNGGELSDWHQPEFTMLEWYELGQTYSGLIDQTEEYLRHTADCMASITGVAPDSILPRTFERVSVFDAFEDWTGITLVDGDPDLAKQCRAQGVVSVQPSDDFETAYFKTLLEKIEPEIACRQGIVLLDYPPSQAALAKVENGRACRFEFYLGRVELCNGFYELTGGKENRERVRLAMAERASHGLEPVPIDPEFFAAMDRLESPCAGNALGLERWMALLCAESSLDAVIPFRRAGHFKAD